MHYLEVTEARCSCQLTAQPCQILMNDAHTFKKLSCWSAFHCAILHLDNRKWNFFFFFKASFRATRWAMRRLFELASGIWLIESVTVIVSLKIYIKSNTYVFSFYGLLIPEPVIKPTSITILIVVFNSMYYNSPCWEKLQLKR